VICEIRKYIHRRKAKMAGLKMKELRTTELKMTELKTTG